MAGGGQGGGRNGVLAVQPGVFTGECAQDQAGNRSAAPGAAGIGLVKCPQFEREGAADVVGSARVGDAGDVEANGAFIKHAADRALQAWLDEAGGLRVAGGVFDGRFFTRQLRNQQHGNDVRASTCRRAGGRAAADVVIAAAVDRQLAQRQFSDPDALVGPELQRPQLATEAGFVAENFGVEVGEVAIEAVTVRLAEAGNGLAGAK